MRHAENCARLTSTRPCDCGLAGTPAAMPDATFGPDVDVIDRVLSHIDEATERPMTLQRARKILEEVMAGVQARIDCIDADELPTE